MNNNTNIREEALTRQDIAELETTITSHLAGAIDEERFRGFRLSRGIYGQRQPGVQMIRMKLPFGRISAAQLRRVADVSDAYSTGSLHLTTRQDIQLHFVSLSRTPDLWNDLAEVGITIREACGNTVRNITASATAGIDPLEPFDVSPYAHATFRYFQRNPICQDLGRKFKIAFASGAADDASTFIHDVGIIPLVRSMNGIEERGFRVVIGGGLGAQPVAAQPTHEFLPEDQLIPFIEALLRVFDRYGERVNRNKARMKYLLNRIGLTSLLNLVEEEQAALKSSSYRIDRNAPPSPTIPETSGLASATPTDEKGYRAWLRTNTFRQKQNEYFAVRIKTPLGNISSKTARAVADLAERHAADDIRVTINQGLLLKFIPERLLPNIYNELDRIGLAGHGFGSALDITACPGTDTCNLGISNSTGIALELEGVIAREYPEFAFRNDIAIKISGCMNSCGQHGLATIGFHGSSLNHAGKVLPALQVMIGGGSLGNGAGRLAERVIKVPSKRGPDALRALLNDYRAHAEPDEAYLAYVDRQGKAYFQRLLKPFADLGSATPDEYIDWGAETPFTPAIGVGECAGAAFDLVATLLGDGRAHWERATETLKTKEWADAIYLAHSALVVTAKALLLRDEITLGSRQAIIDAFDERSADRWPFDIGFRETVLQINRREPTPEFAREYVSRTGEALLWLSSTYAAEPAVRTIIPSSPTP